MANSIVIQGNLIGFVATTDSERSKAFYVYQLGFSFVEDSPYALVLEANGSMIRIQKVAEFTPPGYTVMGWNVDDIRTTVTALAAKGLALEKFEWMPQDDQGIWTTPNGDQIGWLKDPEGQILSLTQFS